MNQNLIYETQYKFREQIGIWSLSTDYLKVRRYQKPFQMNTRKKNISISLGLVCNIRLYADQTLRRVLSNFPRGFKLDLSWQCFQLWNFSLKLQYIRLGMKTFRNYLRICKMYTKIYKKFDTTF